MLTETHSDYDCEQSPSSISIDMPFLEGLSFDVNPDDFYNLGESLQQWTSFEADPLSIDSDAIVADIAPGFNHNGLPALPVVIPSQPRKANRFSFPPMAPIPELHHEPSVSPERRTASTAEPSRRASFSGEVPGTSAFTLRAGVSPLACYYCRGRKIKCSGAQGSQCDQCQRRGRECSYPERSRRGIRPRKNNPNVDAHTLVNSRKREFTVERFRFQSKL